MENYELTIGIGARQAAPRGSAAASALQPVENGLLQFRAELVDPTAFIAQGAVVLGDVTLGPMASVWFNAVVRGDRESIRIGARTNVQDLCVLHADPGYPCELGEGVTVGHAAIVHGATVEAGCLVGMRAVIMNGARIGAGSLIGVGSVIPEGTVIPPGSLVVGTPGRVRETLDEARRERIRLTAEHYAEAAQAYRNQLPEA